MLLHQSWCQGRRVHADKDARGSRQSLLGSGQTPFCRCSPIERVPDGARQSKVVKSAKASSFFANEILRPASPGGFPVVTLSHADPILPCHGPCGRRSQARYARYWNPVQFHKQGTNWGLPSHSEHHHWRDILIEDKGRGTPRRSN